MKKRKQLSIISLIVFIVTVLVIGLFCNFIANIKRPNEEIMEKILQQDREDLQTIVEYLDGLEYDYVEIDKQDINNEIMFTGADSSQQDIESEIAIKSLKLILKKRNFKRIVKNDNTVYFEKWVFVEKSRGLAFVLNNEQKPVVEYLVKSEKLTVNGWYYYESDYEKWRQ